MKNITSITLALVAAAGLTLAGCQKRDDMPATGAGPDTTTTTPTPMPGTTPGGNSTAPADSTTGTPGSMGTSPVSPSASAASQ